MYTKTIFLENHYKLFTSRLNAQEFAAIQNSF
jgi:hypothetical protein